MGLYRKQNYSHAGRDVYSYNNIFLYWLPAQNVWAIGDTLASTALDGYHDSCTSVCPNECDFNWQIVQETG